MGVGPGSSDCFLLSGCIDSFGNLRRLECEKHLFHWLSSLCRAIWDWDLHTALEQFIVFKPAETGILGTEGKIKEFRGKFFS